MNKDQELFIKYASNRNELRKISDKFKELLNILGVIGSIAVIMLIVHHWNSIRWWIWIMFYF